MRLADSASSDAAATIGAGPTPWRKRPTMRSRAATEFDHAIGDATKLLEYFDAVHKENHEKAEVLKRAGLVMALTAWETYVEDRVKEAVGARLEILSGSPISKFVERRLNDELKRFHNPNAEKSAKLFSEYLSIDVTAHWRISRVQHRGRSQGAGRFDRQAWRRRASLQTLRERNSANTASHQTRRTRESDSVPHVSGGGYRQGARTTTDAGCAFVFSRR